jgi:hypothetical protein
MPHGVPAGANGYVHIPFVGSTSPSRWQAVIGGHFTDPTGTQAPLWHVVLPANGSPLQQVIPSLTGIPAVVLT